MTVPNQNAPLRVVLVIGTLNRGGTEGQVVALAARLRQRGHLVRIVCMDKAGDLQAEATAPATAIPLVRKDPVLTFRVIDQLRSVLEVRGAKVRRAGLRRLEENMHFSATGT